MFGNPTEIALLVAAAAVLFGAERIPKLARGLGQAKKEFQMGQAEADIEAERIRTEARTKAEAQTAAGQPVTPVPPAVPIAPQQNSPLGAATPHVPGDPPVPNTSDVRI